MPNYVDGSAHIEANPNTKAEPKRIRYNSSNIDADFGLNQDTDKETITIRICTSDSD